MRIRCAASLPVSLALDLRSEIRQPAQLHVDKAARIHSLASAHTRIALRLAMTMRSRLLALTRGKLIRAIGVLVGGTALAHAITALTLPVLTRLYSPADFGVLAVFASVLSIISVAACLRFEVAILIPAEDSEAVNLLALAVTAAAIVASIVALVAVLVPMSILRNLHQTALQPWLPLLPIGIFLAGAYSALQMWFVRKGAFSSIAISRVTQSGAAAGVQTGLGLLHWAPGGLLLGQLINTGAGVACLIYRFAKEERQSLSDVTLSGMQRAFVAHDRFPKYSTFEALANSASIQLPIILIASVSPGAEAGFLVLAMTAMQAPMSLIGTAVSQVFLSRAPEEARAQRLSSFTATVFGGLLRSGVGPLMFAGLVAPGIFGAVFGNEWRRAGDLVMWMTPWFVAQFLASPVSMALHITGHQRAALMLQIFGLSFRTGAVLVASLIASRFVSEAYALSGGAFYVVYLAVVLRAVKADRVEIVMQIRRNIGVLLAWSALGIGASLLLATSQHTAP